MIRLSHDPVEVNRLLQGIGGSDVDYDDLAESDNWRAWIWGGGLFVVVDTDPGRADVHVFVYPAARGVHAVKAAAAVRRAEAANGITLTGRTPLENRPARRFASLCGGVVVGVENDEEVREWAR